MSFSYSHSSKILLFMHIMTLWITEENLESNCCSMFNSFIGGLSWGVEMHTGVLLCFLVLWSPLYSLFMLRLLFYFKIYYILIWNADSLSLTHTHTRSIMTMAVPSQKQEAWTHSAFPIAGNDLSTCTIIHCFCICTSRNWVRNGLARTIAGALGWDAGVSGGGLAHCIVPALTLFL